MTVANTYYRIAVAVHTIYLLGTTVAVLNALDRNRVAANMKAHSLAMCGQNLVF